MADVDPIWVVCFEENGAPHYGYEARGRNQWDVLEGLCERGEFKDEADGVWWVFRKDDPERVYKMEAESFCEWSYDCSVKEVISSSIEVEGLP